jgi:hypothetical protein
MNTKQSTLDDSQIALQVALRAGIYTAIFFVIISIASNFFPDTAHSFLVDLFLKCLSVFIALALVSSSISEVLKLQNPYSVPFLSTFFFYGVTLFLVYAGQIGYILFRGSGVRHLKYTFCILCRTRAVCNLLS